MPDTAILEKSQFDPSYEITRVSNDAEFRRKMRRKRFLNRIVGEVYVGKRAKLVYFRQWLKDLPLAPNSRVLEVGSGDGLFSFTAAKHRPDWHVVGLELNGTEARVCQEVARIEKIDNLQFTAGLLGDQCWTEQFDLIFCLDVLEHISDDAAALREMFTALKPDGTLLVHVPNRSFLDVDNILRTVPDEQAWQINPGHVRAGYTPVELRSVLENAGFEVKEVRETQGRPIAKAHRLYNRFEHPAWARIIILPMIDHLIRQDRKRKWTHGNTVWAHARKPSNTVTIGATS